jgi:hypothetical protein
VKACHQVISVAALAALAVSVAASAAAIAVMDFMVLSSAIELIRHHGGVA